jgi:uncharacterized protein (DUF1501 family)
VVRHYRSLALFAADGSMRLSAIDPTEDPATAAALVRNSQTALAASDPAPRVSHGRPFDSPPFGRLAQGDRW